jgi:hypothetical protein
MPAARRTGWLGASCLCPFGKCGPCRGAWGSSNARGGRDRLSRARRKPNQMDDQPLPTGIFFSLALTSAGLGTVTVSTPLAKDAFT